VGVYVELAKRSANVHGRPSLLVLVVTQWHCGSIVLAQAGDLVVLRVVDDQVMPLVQGTGYWRRWHGDEGIMRR
jgi:hypothetical protein